MDSDEKLRQLRTTVARWLNQSRENLKLTERREGREEAFDWVIEQIDELLAGGNVASDKT